MENEGYLMNCKIMTFAIILDTTIPDKNKVKEILLDRGYTLKHYDVGLMTAYDKNGKKIENKTTLGRQLIDLQKARDEGAISAQEYAELREKVKKAYD